MKDWITLQSKIPYNNDPDYRKSFIEAIKFHVGDVPIDITSFEVAGSVEVYTDNMAAIEALPLVGRISRSIDREMLCDPRIVV